MKVMHVISRLTCHGAAKQLQLLSQHLPADVVTRVIVLREQPSAVGVWRAAGSDVESLGTAPRLSLTYWWRLRRLARAFRPDIVHAWDAESLTALAGVRSAPIVAGRPLARTGATPGWLARRRLRRARRLVGHACAELAGCLACGVPAERLALVPPAAPMSQASADAAAGPRVPAGRWIVCAGPLTPRKGLYDAIWAFDFVAFVDDDVHLLIVGDGPERSRLEYLRQLVFAKSRIHFLGNNEDATSIIARADVVWAPDLCDSGINVTLEALAAGRPLVASATPARVELLGPGTALLFAPGDKLGLARQTRLVLNQPETARRLAEAGRARVVREFSPEAMARRIEHLYADLAA